MAYFVAKVLNSWSFVDRSCFSDTKLAYFIAREGQTSEWFSKIPQTLRAFFLSLFFSLLNKAVIATTFKYYVQIKVWQWPGESTCLEKNEKTWARKPAFIPCLVLNWIQRVAGSSSGSQGHSHFLCKYRPVTFCAVCAKCTPPSPYPLPCTSPAFPAGAALPGPGAPGWRLPPRPLPGDPLQRGLLQGKPTVTAPWQSQE